MKKIMFNDKYGLTNAVLQGRKTMTRRLCKEYANNEVILAKDVESWLFYPDEYIAEFLMEDGKVKVSNPPYKIGEVVAVAQSYQNAGIDPHFLMFQPIKGSKYLTREEIEAMSTGGWKNKMFVRGELMPHQIRITDIKVERLQDISNEDCEEEGIIPVTWRQYHKQDWDDLSPQRYTDHDVWTLPIFKEGILDPWAESHPDEFIADEPKTAFYVLIRKMMGVKIWEQNPYVFAYTFELIK